MDIQLYTRRGFDVEATQITFENVEDVAKWSGGTVEKRPTKLMGTEAELPVVSLKGVGVDHGNYYIGYLNCWVVKMNKTFRIYKPDQFKRTFLPKSQLTVEDIYKLIEDAGFEVYGEIAPKGTRVAIESTLTAKVHDAIDQALDIVNKEVQAHNSECGA